MVYHQICGDGLKIPFLSRPQLEGGYWLVLHFDASDDAHQMMAGVKLTNAWPSLHMATAGKIAATGADASGKYQLAGTHKLNTCDNCKLTDPVLSAAARQLWNCTEAKQMLINQIVQ